MSSFTLGSSDRMQQTKLELGDYCDFYSHLAVQARRASRVALLAVILSQVICDNCTLRYAIYGVFDWCPDCGVHNSMQILIKNLELARKELLLSTTTDSESAAPPFKANHCESVASALLRRMPWHHA
jgi:hypothetical protein